jgi:hypothetical protein
MRKKRGDNSLGAIEGQPAILVFDGTGSMESPAHFALIDWRNDRIAAIRDFLFAPDELDVIDLGATRSISDHRAIGRRLTGGRGPRDLRAE